MSMLIRVAVKEIDKFVEPVITCYGKTSKQVVARYAINGENVNIDAPQIVIVLAFYQCGICIENLAESPRVAGVCLSTNGLIGLGQPFVGMRHEAVVVRAGHADVHVVIPWDESLVAYGAQHGTSPEIVAQLVFATDLIYYLKYFQYL